ncbi:MAG: RtcB family protein, partial [Planctomycetota bacterium]|nr:RtcB family protein [Planctomycetota bacterium]
MHHSEHNYDTLEGSRVPVKAWTRGVQLADNARKQLLNSAQLPIVHSHIAVMPDVHWGLGATIGSVIPTLGAIVPAAVGVDIGCGMMATRTTLKASDLPDDLKPMRNTIERAVPHGRTAGRRKDKGSWWDVPTRASNLWKEHLN